MVFFRKRKKGATEKEASKFKKEKTQIVVRYNAGYDNNLFIRGHGAGLSWDHGVMLKNIGPDEWVWEANIPFKECEFKVLINDQYYENGENHHIHDGALLQYTPKF
jgi:hypothetical protein